MLDEYFLLDADKATGLTLNHGYPRLGLVSDLCLTAQTHDFMVVDKTSGHPGK